MIEKLQDLTPQDARLCLNMQSFVRHELGVDWRGQSLLLAFSGGADSTALLVMLCALRFQSKLRVAAAHLDHGLRPGSAEDAEAAGALCAKLGLPFYGERRDIATLAAVGGQGLEEAGRKARYDFLEETRDRIHADWILTAHHAGDLAEDMLLRLVRGTSWPGLGAMPGKRGRVLRPALMLDKEDLVGLLCRQGIIWREDESNQSRSFRRNRIRLDLMPLLLAENPNFLDSARNLWRTARQDEEFWDNMLKDVVQEEALADMPPAAGENFPQLPLLLLAHERLLALPKAARMRAYARSIKRLGKGQARASVLFELDNAVMACRHGKCFQLSGNIKVLVERRGVIFQEE